MSETISTVTSGAGLSPLPALTGTLLMDAGCQMLLVGLGCHLLYPLPLCPATAQGHWLHPMLAAAGRLPAGLGPVQALSLGLYRFYGHH